MRPPRSCFIDGIQFASGCTLGKGNIEARPSSSVSATFLRGGRKIRLTVRDSILQTLSGMASDSQAEALAREILRKKDEEIFLVEGEQLKGANLRDGIIANIEGAVRMIEGCSECASVLPEVGTNIAMALPGARCLDDVAGLTGRIIRVEDRAVGVGRPKFGATRYMGCLLYTSDAADE